MQRIIGMYKQFLWEPLWFKILIIASLLAAVVFSSSFFADHGYYQSIAKIAAAIFLGHTGSDSGLIPGLLLSFLELQPFVCFCPGPT